MKEIFHLKEYEKKLKKLENWDLIEDKIYKRLLFQNIANDHVLYLIYENDNDKIVFRLIEQKAFVSYNSEFIKNSQIAHLYYSRSNKKFYESGNKQKLLEFLLSIKDLKKTLNLEWEGSKQLQYYNNKVILKKLLLGEITNQKIFIEYYFRYTWKIKKNEVKANLIIEKYLKNKNFGLFFLGKALSVSLNTENTIKRIHTIIKQLESNNRFNPQILEYHDHNYTLLNDIIEQAKLLQIKLNFNWSKKRFLEEHSKMSEEIWIIKGKYIVPEKIEYSTHYNLEYGTILNSNTEIYNEGVKLRHCVFSNNYWEKYVRKRTGLILRYDYKQKRGTALIMLKKIKGEFKPVISQFFGYKNNKMDDDSTKILKKSLKNELKEIALKELEYHYT